MQAKKALSQFLSLLSLIVFGTSTLVVTTAISRHNNNQVQSENPAIESSETEAWEEINPDEELDGLFRDKLSGEFLASDGLSF